MAKKKKAKKKKAAKKKKTSKTNAKFVKLYLIKIKDKKGATVTSPNKQHISLVAEEEVEWRAKGPFTVDFDGANGSPFDDSHFEGSDGFPANSGPAVNGEKGVDYKYTAQFGSDTAEDPIIHTDE